MRQDQDKEYQTYVNHHDKLLEELDVIRLQLSRDALARSPQERLRWFKTMVHDADRVAQGSGDSADPAAN